MYRSNNGHYYSRFFCEDRLISNFIERNVHSNDFTVTSKEKDCTYEHDLRVKVDVKAPLSPLQKRMCLSLPDGRTVGFNYSM